MDKWKPKEGESFYFIASTFMQSFDVVQAIYDKRIARLGVHIANHNCFQTEKEAKEMAEQIKKLLKKQQ